MVKKHSGIFHTLKMCLLECNTFLFSSNLFTEPCLLTCYSENGCDAEDWHEQSEEYDVTVLAVHEE